MPDFTARFWSKVDQSGDCWLWTDVPQSAGYGMFHLNGRRVLAHRLSYELNVGPIPDGHEIDHRPTCPKNCVNPAHLRAVTHKQNLENRAGAPVNSTSGVRGVSWWSARSCWKGTVTHCGKHFHVGYFATVEEASAAVVAKRLELHTNNQLDRAGCVNG